MDYDNITQIDFMSLGKLNIMLKSMTIFVRLEGDSSKLHELQLKGKKILLKGTSRPHKYSHKHKYFYLDDQYDEDKIGIAMKGSNESKIGNIKSMRQYSEAELQARMSASNIKASDGTRYKISANNKVSRKVNEILLDL